MQLYNVKFRHHKEKVIDIGEVVVVASSNELAAELVLLWLELPRSKTSTEVKRMKPNMYQVMRGEIPKEMPANGTFPRTQAEMDRLLEPDRERYTVQISALVWAHSEDNAIKKLAKAALAEVDGSAVKPNAKAIGMLQILCDRQDLHPRSPAVESNSIFTHLRMFQGGDTRSG
jgi:hypothetical protein